MSHRHFPSVMMGQVFRVCTSVDRRSIKSQLPETRTYLSSSTFNMFLLTPTLHITQTWPTNDQFSMPKGRMYREQITQSQNGMLPEPTCAESQAHADTAGPLHVATFFCAGRAGGKNRIKRKLGAEDA